MSFTYLPGPSPFTSPLLLLIEFRLFSLSLLVSNSSHHLCVACFSGLPWVGLYRSTDCALAPCLLSQSRRTPFFFILFFYTLSSFIYHYPLSLSLSISLNSIYLQYIKSFITFYSSFEFPNTCFCFFDLKLLKNSFDLTRVVDYLFLTHTYLISFLLIPRYIYASISHIHIPSSSYNSLHLHLLPSSPPFSFCLFIRFHIHIQAFKIHFSPPHLFFCLCKLALI